MSALDEIRAARHLEILGRFDKLEVRVRDIELTIAANAPLIKGAKGVFVMLSTAMLAGYLGSVFV